MGRICKVCGTTDITQFRMYRHSGNGSLYYDSRCRQCKNKQARDYRSARKDAGLPSQYNKEYQHRYREKHKERLKVEKKAWYLANKTMLNARSRKYNKTLRHAVLFHYSDGLLNCKCCGENCFEFLTLDHINGLDETEKKSIWHLGKYYRKRSSGSALWSRLRSEGYPSGFQVLCWNCNCAKGLYGACPHKLKVMVNSATN